MRLEFKLRTPEGFSKCDYPQIRIGAMKFLCRCHGNSTLNGGWGIASWHWKNSITWRWTIQWHPNKSHTFLYKYPNGKAGTAALSLWRLGHLYFAWQENMWRQ